ncbi:MAG: hypothetical protein ACXW3K_02440 [Brevundimonas sp.]
MEFNGRGMGCREWIRKPDRWTTMTKALVGVGLWLTLHGALRALDWLIG